MNWSELTEHDNISRETVRRRLTEDDLETVAQGHVVHSAYRRSSTSLAWRMCSTYMRRVPDPRSARLSVSTREPDPAHR